MTLRQRLARRLRFLADRIDYDGAPKADTEHIQVDWHDARARHVGGRKETTR